MAATADRLSIEGFKSNTERKKRLGQYFTGVQLARLLAALSDAQTATSIIDPMGGTGDMLIGCLEHGARPAGLATIEIDPIARATCEDRLRDAGADRAQVLLGDAFSTETLRQLPTTMWDVCITNPPYVRYQSVSRPAGRTMRLPSGAEIRKGLLQCIDELDALDHEDKRHFRVLAEGYSGLADMAVPSWILCAGLVQVGGTLAMLVPAAWLNRDYAHPIRYLLRRWFETRYVVEDADATWFDDALVRTTLVVATRVERRPSAFSSRTQDGYLHLRVGNALADGRSLVGAAYPESDDPDLDFAADAAEWHASRGVVKRASTAGHWVDASLDASRLRQVAKGVGWLDTLESPNELSSGSSSRLDIPAPLVAAVGELPSGALVTADELGWRVGQGLRTGGNDFFYVEAVGTDEPATVRVSRTLGSGLVSAPNDALRPVLRRQADLPHTFVISAADLSGRVLVLSSYALPEDIDPGWEGHYRDCPNPLAQHIRRSVEVNIGSPDEPKTIPSLSAVAPNVRPPSPLRPDVPPRFWYQLPPFTSRHQPSLTLPRVNHTHPTTYLNKDRGSIVDANFSSLWPVEGAVIDQHALLAIMNSVWVLTSMELACTVLGGGALKVEAAHLRRLPFPSPRPAVRQALSVLGHQLALSEPTKSRPILNEIDSLVVGELVGKKRCDAAIRCLRRLAAERLTARST